MPDTEPSLPLKSPKAPQDMDRLAYQKAAYREALRDLMSSSEANEWVALMWDEGKHAALVERLRRPENEIVYIRLVWVVVQKGLRWIAERIWSDGEEVKKRVKRSVIMRPPAVEKVDLAVAEPWDPEEDAVAAERPVGFHVPSLGDAQDRDEAWDEGAALGLAVDIVMTCDRESGPDAHGRERVVRRPLVLEEYSNPSSLDRANQDFDLFLKRHVIGVTSRKRAAGKAGDIADACLYPLLYDPPFGICRRDVAVRAWGETEEKAHTQCPAVHTYDALFLKRDWLIREIDPGWSRKKFWLCPLKLEAPRGPSLCFARRDSYDCPQGLGDSCGRKTATLFVRGSLREMFDPNSPGGPIVASRLAAPGRALTGDAAIGARSGAWRAFYDRREFLADKADLVSGAIAASESPEALIHLIGLCFGEDLDEDEADDELLTVSEPARRHFLKPLLAARQRNRLASALRLLLVQNGLTYEDLVTFANPTDDPTDPQGRDMVISDHARPPRQDT